MKLTSEQHEYAAEAADLRRQAVAHLRETGDWPTVGPIERRLWQQSVQLDDVVAKHWSIFEVQQRGQERRLRVLPDAILGSHRDDDPWLAPLAVWARACADGYARALESQDAPAVRQIFADIHHYWPRETEALAVARIVWDGLGPRGFVAGDGLANSSMESISMLVRDDALLYRECQSITDMLSAAKAAEAVESQRGEPAGDANKMLRLVWTRAKQNSGWPSLRELVLAWDGSTCAKPLVHALAGNELCRPSSPITISTRVRVAGVPAFARICDAQDARAFVLFVRTLADMMVDSEQEHGISLTELAMRAQLDPALIHAAALIAEEEMWLGSIERVNESWRFRPAKSAIQFRKAKSLPQYLQIREAERERLSGPYGAALPRKGSEKTETEPVGEAQNNTLTTGGVFYSWQNTTDNKCNRYLIEAAIKKALTVLHREGELTCRPELNQDARGERGTVNIRDAILAKIDRCSVLVADLTLVGKLENGRPTPNPNVLFELGYAWSRLGPENIILVMNTSHGAVEELPFDLRGYTALLYECAAGVASVEARDKLVPRLKSALEAILVRTAPVSAASTELNTESQGSLATLSADDVALFRAAYAMMLETSSPLVSFDQLLQVGARNALAEPEVTDTTQVLNDEGFWKAATVMGPHRYSHVSWTSKGMDAYGQAFLKGFERLRHEAAHVLVHEGITDCGQLADRLHRPRLLVEHVLAVFEQNDLVRCSRSHDGVDVRELKPKLRRLMGTNTGIPV